ncbi:MAG TPA: hypothetical protein VIV60_32775 [Polyangiaceae bacterium]
MKIELPNASEQGGVVDGEMEGVRRRVLDLIRQTAPANVRNKNLRGTERLVDLGLGSLRLVGFFVALEEAFQLSEAILAELSGDLTIDDLVAICSNRHGARGGLR